jgi:hypothetical protein
MVVGGAESATNQCEISTDGQLRKPLVIFMVHSLLVGLPIPALGQHLRINLVFVSSCDLLVCLSLLLIGGISVRQLQDLGDAGVGWIAYRPRRNKNISR